MRDGLAQRCGRSWGNFDVSPAKPAEWLGFELSDHAPSAQVLDILPGWILCDRLSCANRARVRNIQQPTKIFSISEQALVLRFRRNPAQLPQPARRTRHTRMSQRL